MIEILFILIMAAFMVAPWFIVGLPLWGTFYSVVVGIHAVFEGYAKVTSGRTLSQKFWAYSKVHKSRAILVLVSVTIAHIMLMWHLAEKIM